jgi:hypothetical protein
VPFPVPLVAMLASVGSLVQWGGFLPQTVTGARADGTRPLVGPRCFPRRPRPYPSASRRQERRSAH